MIFLGKGGIHLQGGSLFRVEEVGEDSIKDGNDESLHELMIHTI